MPAPIVSTPCVKVCVIDPLSDLCIGCGRTVDGNRRLDDDERELSA